MRGNGSHGRVVLVFQALPNCGQPNESIASRIRPVLRGMVLKHVPTNLVVDPVGCGSEIADGPLPCLPVPRRLTNVCTVARVSDKGKERSPEREPAAQLGPTHIYVVCTLQAMWHGMIVGTDLSGSHTPAQDLAPPKRGFSFGCWNLLGPHAVWQARCILDLTSTAVAELRRRTARQRRLTRRQEAHSTSWRAVGLPSLNRRIGWTSTTATGNATKNEAPEPGGYNDAAPPVAWVAAITSPNASLFNHGNQEEAHMSRITALFVGIAALTIVSTVAEAADGCGRGWYYNGRRCVPQDEPGYGYRRDYGPPQYRGDYGPVDRGPGLRLDLGGRRDEARYSPPNPAFKTWNNCPPNFTVQDGLCKPYRGR
jgi:hypothetical protein